MPSVEIGGPGGPWKFCYAISTPTKVSAERVDPDVPTVVFLHAYCTVKETFQCQFDSPLLRQFNLVTFDLRGFGETGGLITKTPLVPSDVANDVYNLLEALKIPPCHIFGLAIGYYAAFDLAVRYPDRVLSVIACSPMSPTEGEDVAYGRIQMFKYLENYARPKIQGGTADEEFSDDVTLCAVQLMFNVIHTPLLHAVTRLSWEYIVQNWTESEECLRTCWECSVRVSLDRKPFTKDYLAKIRCPVTVIHCADDVAYDVEAAHELRDRLVEAGVQVSPLEIVPGPHFACLTHPNAINLIIFDDVVSNWPGNTSSQFRVKKKKTDIQLETPFLPHLVKHGYCTSDDSDSE